MIELDKEMLVYVEGAGWASFILPVVSGFIFGGPVGVVAVAATFVATKGIDNLEHLHKHNEIPTLPQMFGAP